MAFRTWKTITLGTHPTMDALRGALEAAGNRVMGGRVNEMLSKTPLSRKEVSVDLVVVPIEDLGFTKATRYDDILKCAVKRGLDKCPAEVGPQLRLQYPNQPHGDVLFIAMDPILAFNGDLRIFMVERYVGEHRLDFTFGFPNDLWYPGHLFVFVRRK